MGCTISEKILGGKSGMEAKRGSMSGADVYVIMASIGFFLTPNPTFGMHHFKKRVPIGKE